MTLTNAFSLNGWEMGSAMKCSIARDIISTRATAISASLIVKIKHAEMMAAVISAERASTKKFVMEESVKFHVETAPAM